MPSSHATKSFSDSERFQYVVDRLLKSPRLPTASPPMYSPPMQMRRRSSFDGLMQLNQLRTGTTAIACRSMDIALVATVKYLKKVKNGKGRSEMQEQKLSEFWLDAAEKVALVDPKAAEALHFKGMGWLDDSMWDLAEGRDMKISIEDMQVARQKLSHAMYTEGKMGESPTWEKVSIFVFGVVFITLLVGISLFLPNPTDFQYTTLRIVLALAAAGIAALVPGFIEVQYKQIIRAGGAIAVFVIVYFFSPATLVSDRIPAPTDLFSISVVSENYPNVQIVNFSFPVSDIRKNSSSREFIALLRQLPGQSESILKSTVFRLWDEKVIDLDTGNPIDRGNMGVLVIPNSVLENFDDQHLAFTFFKSQL